MEEKNYVQKPIWKSILFTLLIFAILIPIVIGFSLIKIPFWPVLIYFFYYVIILHLDPTKFFSTAVGGLIGILVSFSGPVLGHFLGKDIGQVIYLILLFAMITLLIDGRIKYVNDASNLFLMCLTLVTLQDTTYENFLPLIGSYFVAVLIFYVIYKVIKSKAKAK